MFRIRKGMKINKQTKHWLGFIQGNKLLLSVSTERTQQREFADQVVDDRKRKMRTVGGIITKSCYHS